MWGSFSYLITRISVAKTDFFSHYHPIATRAAEVFLDVRNQNNQLLGLWDLAYLHNQMFRTTACIPLAPREGARRGKESHLFVGGVLREGVLQGG